MSTKYENYIAEEPNQIFRSQVSRLKASMSPESQIELTDRIDTNLKFGTAGLRGKMEGGYNRMNLVTVYRCAHSLASSLAAANNPRVVIGFDARLNSHDFAQEAAQVLSRLGVSVDIFAVCVPTPLCAYATKYLAAHAGMMITASHNPGYDNGIKLFDSSGAQAGHAWSLAIEHGMIKAPRRCDFLGNETKQLINHIKPELIDAYFQEIGQAYLFKQADLDKDLSIVYTPLHGVGRDFFVRALKSQGFNNIHVVQDQAEPDGSFPTVIFPNPEEQHALDRAHQEARNLSIDWVFANDPDADRLQLSCYDQADFKKLSGNEMGVILGYFVIDAAIRKGQKPLVASSIVSSRMLEAMATQLGAHYIDALTGFANIAENAIKAEQRLGCPLVFAYEEAIGFLVGKTILDKDGINTGLRFMEIACYLSKQQKTIWQFLDELYLRFGVFMSDQWSWRMPEVADIMTKLRSLTTAELTQMFGRSGWRIYDLAHKQKADVIIFEIKNQARFIVRPSGTEPKIKFYFELMDHADNLLLLNRKKIELKALVSKHRQAIEKFLT